MAEKTFDELLSGAQTIRDNELPESNTHTLVGEQLVNMVEKNKEESGKKLAISDLASGRGESTTTAMTQAAVTQELETQDEKLTELSSRCVPICAARTFVDNSVCVEIDTDNSTFKLNKSTFIFPNQVYYVHNGTVIDYSLVSGNTLFVTFNFETKEIELSTDYLSKSAYILGFFSKNMLVHSFNCGSIKIDGKLYKYNICDTDISNNFSDVNNISLSGIGVASASFSFTSKLTAVKSIKVYTEESKKFRLTYFGYNNNRVSVSLSDSEEGQGITYYLEENVSEKPSGVLSYKYIGNDIIIYLTLDWDKIEDNYFIDGTSDITLISSAYRILFDSTTVLSCSFKTVDMSAFILSEFIKAIRFKDYNYSNDVNYQLGYVGYNNNRISAIIYRGEEKDELNFRFEEDVLEKPQGIKEYYLDNGSSSLHIVLDWDKLNSNFWGLYSDNRAILIVDKKIEIVNDYQGGTDKAASAEDVKKLQALISDGLTSEYYYNHSYAINTLPINPERLNILTLGNSYTGNIYTRLKDILDNLGITNVTYARVFNPGATLGEKASSDYLSLYNDMVIAGSVFQEFWCYDSETQKSTSYKYEYTLDDVLTFKDWDIIIFQNGSSDSADYDLYQPYLNKCIEYVLSKSKPRVVLGFNMTWSWGSKSPLYDTYPATGGNQNNMNAGIIDAAKKVAQDTGINYTCSAGICITALRESKYNNEYTDDNTPYEFMEANTPNQARHLVGAIPLFTVAAAFAETFICPCFGKSIATCTLTVSDNTYNMPVTEDNRQDLIEIAKSSCANHFEIEKLDLVTVSGRVIDSTSSPLQGAKINISNDSVEGNYSAFSKKDGTFSMKIKREVAESTIKISLSGYNSYSSSQVISNDLTLGDITLAP